MDQPINHGLEGRAADIERNECLRTLEKRLESYENRLKELTEENEDLKLVIRGLRAAIGEGDSAHEEIKEPGVAMGDSSRTEVEERILRYLAAIGVASTHEITSVLGLTKKHARLHVGDLSRAGLVNECATPRRLSVLEKHRLLEQSSRSWGLTGEGRQYVEARGLTGDSGPK